MSIKIKKNTGREDFEYAFNNDSLLNILSSSGRSRAHDDFPLLRVFIEEVRSYPFVKSYNMVKIDCTKMLVELERMGAAPIYRKDKVDEETFEAEPDRIVFRLGKGYYLLMDVGYETADSFSNMEEYIRSLENSNFVTVASVELLYPPDNSSLKNKDIEESVHEMLKRCVLNENTKSASIGMICIEEGSFYLKHFVIKDYTINEPDLHYGEGFSDFNKNLVKRFKVDNKGLFLLYGDPGTGKTYYIRSLLKDLVNMGKVVIYLPPNMIDHMVSPDMLGFLSELVINEAEKGKNCVLLIEDAEPLLVSRDLDNRRTSGITNLLNITDGLLNDMFSLQVIATFNTSLSKIDEALLRPERLIARKEFKKLKREDAQRLVKSLEMSIEVKDDMSLAEIYSMNKENEVLIHEYDADNKKRVGFKI